MSPIRFFSIAPLLLITAVWAQDVSKPISFQEPAASADKVLADLSKLSGVKLEADPEMSREILLVSVKNIPLADLMKKIAAVSSGIWFNTNDEYKLVPDQGLRSRQEEKELKARADGIERSLNPPAKPVPAKRKGAGETAASDDEDQSVAIDDTLPFGGSSLLKDIVKQVDPMTLAQLRSGERIVFSSNPTAMQMQLPPVSNDKIAAFIKEHNAQVEETTKSQQSVTNQAQAELAQQVMEQLGMGGMMKPITGMPSTLLVAFSSGGPMGMGGIAADLTMYDRSGKVIYADRTNISYNNAVPKLAMRAAELAAGKKGPEPPQKGTPIQFDPIDQAFLELGGNATMGGGGKQPKLAPELEARLLHPESFDPLSFVNSAALCAVAAEKNEALVADLPDSMVSMFSPVHKGVTTAEYLAQLDDGEDVEVRNSESWLLVAPKAPAANRKDRLNRRALGVLINASKAKGNPSLDDLSQYALSSEEPDFSGPATLYLSLYAPSLMMGMTFASNDWQSLRLYGLLTEAQRDSLRNGAVLGGNSLTPDQLSIIKAMVYGDKANLVVARAGEAAKKPKGFFEMAMSSYMPGEHEDYLDEPTESLPQGLPPSLSLRAAVSTQTAVKVAGDDSPALRFGVLGVDEYSMLSYFLSSPMAAQAGGFMPKMDKLQVGKRDIYDFTIQLLPNISVKKKLTDDSVAKDAAVVGTDNLPADFKSAVQAKIEEMKKSPFMQGIFTNFNTKPPVPPAP